MTIEDENKEKELQEKKELVFYSEAVRTWYLTSMEHDKSLLTLSAGGIGLLVTLLTKFNTPLCEVRIFYIAAILSFCVCLGSVLAIFKRNRKHLEDLIHSNITTDSVLQRLDTVAVWSFGVGVIFSSLIGISAAITPEKKIEAGTPLTMEKTTVKDRNTEVANTGDNVGIESLDGAANLKPTATLTKLRESVDGAAKLKPAAPQNSSNQTGSTQNSKPVQGS